MSPKRNVWGLSLTFKFNYRQLQNWIQQLGGAQRHDRSEVRGCHCPFLVSISQGLGRASFESKAGRNTTAALQKKHTWTTTNSIPQLNSQDNTQNHSNKFHVISHEPKKIFKPSWFAHPNTETVLVEGLILIINLDEFHPDAAQKKSQVSKVVCP